MKLPSAPQSRRIGGSMVLLPTGELLSMGSVMMKAISLCNSNTVDKMSSKSDIETDCFIENPVCPSLLSLLLCLPSWVPVLLPLPLHLVP